MGKTIDSLASIIDWNLVELHANQFKTKYSEEYKKGVGAILDKFSSYSATFYPSSTRLEETYEAIRIKLCEKAGRAYVETTFNDDYNRFKLSAVHSNLMPNTTDDPLADLYEEVAVQEQLRHIYSSETDSLFQFTGKQILSDIINLDRNSYFDKRESIIATIMDIQDIELELQRYIGFKSSEQNYSEGIKLYLNSFEEEMSANNKDMAGGLYSRVYEQVDVSSLNGFEKNQYDSIIRHYVMGFGEWGYTEFHKSIFNHLDTIGTEINNLSLTYTNMEDVYYKVQSMGEQIEDITTDLERVVNDLATIQFENINRAMDELTKIVKENYILSGEADTDVLDTSLLAEDKAFVEQAKRQKEIDLYFDLGLMEDGIERDEVRYEELRNYIERGRLGLQK
ncbi:MAG: hypothetical protein ACK5LZ_06770 [Anaerorhabdus sp.]